MTTNKAIITATLAEAETGKAFTNIEDLPEFAESNFALDISDHRATQDFQKKIDSITKIPKSEEFDGIMETLRNFFEELPKI